MKRPIPRGVWNIIEGKIEPPKVFILRSRVGYRIIPIVGLSKHQVIYHLFRTNFWGIRKSLLQVDDEETFKTKFQQGEITMERLLGTLTANQWVVEEPVIFTEEIPKVNQAE